MPRFARSHQPGTAAALAQPNWPSTAHLAARSRSAAATQLHPSRSPDDSTRWKAANEPTRRPLGRDGIALTTLDAAAEGLTPIDPGRCTDLPIFLRNTIRREMTTWRRESNRLPTRC